MHLIQEFEITILREKSNTVNVRNYTSFGHNNNDTFVSSAISITSATSVQSLSSNSSNFLGSSDIKTEFQYYLIGVYSFFGVLFAIGLFLTLARKIKKSCTSSIKYSGDEYDSVAGGNCNPQDNPGFEEHSNLNSLEPERSQEHDSDYDYYSSDEGDAEYSKDAPPDYEHPPPYDTTSPK